MPFQFFRAAARMLSCFRSCVIFAACAAGLSHWVLAAPGKMEAAFVPGIHHGDLVNAVLPLPDGRVLVTGTFDHVGGVPQRSLARLNPDGTLDHSFRPELSGVFAILLLDDGKILVGGNFTSLGGVTRHHLARLNGDGTLDETFVAGTDGYVSALLPQAGGQVLVAGGFTYANGHERSYLARLNADGTTDESFSVTLDGTVHGLGRHGDGRFYVLGSFGQVQGVSRPYVARLSADGVLDESFAPVVNGLVQAVAMQPNGATLMAGRFTTVNGLTRQRVARILADGSLDPQFTPTVNHDVYAMDLQANGRILICGAFGSVGGVTWRGIARLQPTGFLDSGFISTWQSGFYLSIALQGNGKVLTGGGSPPLNYQAPSNVARLENDAATQSLSATNEGRVQWLRGGAAPEVVGTTFDLSTDGGNSWSGLGTGTRISGGWELTGLSLPAAGVLRARARRETGEGSSTLIETVTAFGLTEPAPQPEIAIKAPDGSDLTDNVGNYTLAAHRVPQTFTIKNTGTAPLQITGITFSGGDSAAFEADLSGMLTCIPAGGQTACAVTLEPFGNYVHTDKMIVANDDASENPFDIWLKGPGAVSARIDLAQMSFRYGTATFVSRPLIPSFHPSVTDYSVTIPANLAKGLLDIGFSPNNPDSQPVVTIDGLPVNDSGGFVALPDTGSRECEVRMTSKDGSNTRTYRVQITRSAAQPGDFDPGLDAGIAGTVRTSVVLPNGEMLIAGSFSSVQGVTVQNLARLRADGTVDAAFAPKVGGSIYGLAALPDGMVYIFGSFTTVNGTQQRHVARLTKEGALDMDFRPYLDSSVSSLAVQDDGKIIISGAFSRVNTAPVAGLARLHADGSEDVTFKPAVNDSVWCLAVQPDGKILVGGDSKLLRRLNADGTVDPAFNAPNEVLSTSSLALQPDGKILHYSEYTTPGSTTKFYLGRLMPNGEKDAFFNGPASSYCLRADGKIVIASSESAYRVDNGGGIETAFDSDRLEIGHGGSYLECMMVAENGAPYVGGNFTDWLDFNRRGLVRLHDEAAPATLPPVVLPPSELRWQQESGGAPMAERVLFQISADDGVTWEDLGHAQYSGGAWSRQGLDLPPVGKVRAIALVRSGAENKSQGLFASPAVELALEPARIGVSWMPGDPVISGETVTDFGAVGLKSEKTFTLMVENQGQTNLELGTPALTGPHAAMFKVMRAPEDSPNGGAAFWITFTPTATGVKTATLRLPSNDGMTPVFEVLLKGTGVKALPPVVKTLSAEVTGPTTVILKGSIDTKGTVRKVFFDWGTTTKYDLISGDPAPVAGAGVIPFQATLTELQPHTKYNFRLRAFSDEGAAAGANATFTTGNTPPVAVNDVLRFIQGATVTIPLLGNDTDADGDALKLISVAAPAAASKVKVVKTGDQATITFGPGAASPTTFTYKISDGFGGTAVGVVTVEAASTQTPSSNSLSFDFKGGTKSLNLPVTGAAFWSGKPSATWIRPGLISGYDSGSISLGITVSVNTAKTPRSGHFDIGDRRFFISQSGAVAPVLSQPGTVPPGMISTYYSLRVPTQNAPATYTVTGLPPGLKMNGATGVIEGYPTKVDSFEVTVKARNAAGAAVTAPKFTITILPLPEGAVGVFHGYVGVPASGAADGNFMSRFEMTTTATGLVTGKLFKGSTFRSFKGRLSGDPNNAQTASISIDVPAAKKGEAAESLYLKVNTVTGVASGSENGAPITAWRQVWKAITKPATAYAGAHSFYLMPPYAYQGLPQGYGFAVFTVDEKTGTYNLVGKLANGTAVLTSSFVGPTGQLLVYQGLYKDQGSFGGVLTRESDLDIVGTASWYKPAATATDTDPAYRDGFYPSAYTARGKVLPPVAAGGVFGNFTNEDDNARLSFAAVGSDPAFNITFSLRNPGSALVNTATFPADANPNAVTLTLISPATGAFAGHFTLPGGGGQPPRQAFFQGQAVSVGTNSQVRGHGFFLLPQTAVGPGPAPQFSGTVVLFGQ